jgi:hypothetical protein
MHFMIGFAIFVILWGVFPRVMGWIFLLAFIAIVVAISNGQHP